MSSKAYFASGDENTKVDPAINPFMGHKRFGSGIFTKLKTVDSSSLLPFLMFIVFRPTTNFED